MEKVFFPLTPECQDRNSDWQWRDRARLVLQGIDPDMRANTIQKGIELMRLMQVCAFPTAPWQALPTSPPHHPAGAATLPSNASAHMYSTQNSLDPNPLRTHSPPGSHNAYSRTFPLHSLMIVVFSPLA